MMVSNHFDVRWVDGYSAVSDVPSSLAAAIEKMAADLPSSHDRIELAVRDVRRPDGVLVQVGLLRFVVAVSSAPRPLGFLHAVVFPGAYCLDMDGWRALVARRYGGHPEERIRAVYEELAESTRDTGRDRLHALAIRPEDVRELLEPLDETERTPIPRPRPPTIRPPSRPPANRLVIPAPAAAPKSRPSHPALSMSVRAVSLPESAELSNVDDLPGDLDLPNDVTQPMEAPPGTAAPLSGEHPKQLSPVKRPQRARWVAGAALGALVLLLGGVGWLGHRHRLVVHERDRLESELSKRHPDQDALEQKVREIAAELAKEREQNEAGCRKRIEDGKQGCEADLKLKLQQYDRADQELSAARRERDNALSQLTKANGELAAATKATNEALEEQRRAASARWDQLDAANKQLRIDSDRRYEQLKVLCKGLQSARKHPKECQGI